jgi:predicted sulfurtransferase/23S rRNA-/tRNA-specific pseudouridylate synthase
LGSESPPFNHSYYCPSPLNNDGAGTPQATKSADHPEKMASVAPKGAETAHIILFYRYHELSSDRDLMEMYRSAMERLCEALHLKGRILIGCSDKAEGINGTLAGSHGNVRMFTYALLGKDYADGQEPLSDTLDVNGAHTTSVLTAFWIDCQSFADLAGVPVLTMASPDDFKWSKSNEESLFPDLNVKLVKEVIGTGGLLSFIEVADTSKGYLTPEQWHQELQGIDATDTVLIDCRNTKECQIGHFPNAIDPNTTTFAQFPHWVQQNEVKLANKKVLMYCTGGIRCEKASQFIRTQVANVQSVHHLKGGIHKYLEQYGSEGLWQGKNFVFDGRGAASGSDTKAGKDKRGVDAELEVSVVGSVVGKCLYCTAPYDTFHPSCVCTVCREPTLVCDACRTSTPEYHCKDHFHLRSCYFSNLTRYSTGDLEKQLGQLEELIQPIAVGKRYKQKRKTLQKQMEKIRDHLEAAALNISVTDQESSTMCRNCGGAECLGGCWGFHGLKRKEALEKQKTNKVEPSLKKARQSRLSSNQRNSKQGQKERAIEEIKTLGLAKPPSMYRDPESGIRVPPPCIRVMRTLVKGKWCGKTTRQIAKEEFPDLSKDISRVVDNGLLKVNGHVDVDIKLKNMDEICRIMHWHEPPVIVPEHIHVQRICLEQAVIDEYNLVASERDTLEIYACNKPSSVPVHPAGPYLANCLTTMVESALGLEPRALIPCHRIDRITSGLTICCTNTGVARLLQSKMDEGRVRKLYVARVRGFFPSTEAEFRLVPIDSSQDVGNIKFVEGCIEVNAPIETSDAAAGIRIVSIAGKPSKSRFRCLAYDDESNTSLLSCYPMTGRGHQLRVHLQLLGHPIVDDVQYGGSKESTSYMTRAIEQIRKSALCEIKEKGNYESFSPSEASSAKEICRCCNQGEGGVAESFTESQLLHYGYSIALHAVKYEISIPRKKKENSIDFWSDGIAKILLSVELPKWARDVDKSKLSWL